MSKKRIIVGKAGVMDTCVTAIIGKYRDSGYDVQQMRFSEEGTEGALIQIKNATSGGSNFWKSISGLKTCACLKLIPVGNALKVEVTAGKWLDKVAVNVVSWFVLWPLFATSVIGMVKQGRLVDDVFADILVIISET